MKPRKILLTGPEWFGDLLPFLESALHGSGAEVRRLAVNQTPWLGRAQRRRMRVGSIPWLGRRVAHRMYLAESRQLRAHVRTELNDTLQNWQPDVMLSLLCWGDTLPGELLHQHPAPRRIGWLMDDPFWGNGELLEGLMAFDSLFTVDESWNVPLQLLTGKSIETLVCGADPQSFRPLPPESITAEFRSEMVFVGSSYEHLPAARVRKALLGPLVPLGLRIFGDPGWRGEAQLAPSYARGPITTEESNLAYNGAKLALNVHHPQFRAGTSLRTFAICAAGACQLVDWRPGLEQFFTLEREILTYRSPEELAEKAKYYLAHDDARRGIASAGRERVLREHTYAHRLQRLLQSIT